MKKAKPVAKAARKAGNKNPLPAGEKGMAGGTPRESVDVDMALRPASTKTSLSLTPFPILRNEPRKGQVRDGERRIEQWEAEQFLEQANRTLADVTLFADRGDAKAVELLATIATDAIQVLRGLAERQPELLRPFARKCACWPDMVAKHPGAKRRNDWLLEELQVGAESADAVNWRVDSPASQQALFLRNWLGENQVALGLPDLTHATRKKWFEAGWKCLLQATDGKPEKDKFLAQIGQHRAKHSEHEGQQTHATARTSATNVRDGIKARLWQSFQTLTKRFPLK